MIEYLRKKALDFKVELHATAYYLLHKQEMDVLLDETIKIVTDAQHYYETIYSDSEHGKDNLTQSSTLKRSNNYLDVDSLDTFL